MSIGATKKFLAPDLEAEGTLWGRVDQGRRELAVQLKKDVTVEKLAELADLTGPSLSGWKAGGRPKRESLEAVASVFLAAGLSRYTTRYLDYGDEPGEVVAEKVLVTPYRLARTREEEEAARKSPKRRSRGGE